MRWPFSKKPPETPADQSPRRSHVMYWMAMQNEVGRNGKITLAYRTAYRPDTLVEEIPRRMFDWTDEELKKFKLDNDGKNAVLINCGVIYT